MESATPSPFTKAFWRLFHGNDVSNHDARTLWKHLRIMSEIVIGQCFAGDSAPASLGIRTVSPGKEGRAGSLPAATH